MAEPKITVDFRSLKQISRQSQRVEHIPGSLVTWARVRGCVWVIPRRSMRPSVTRGVGCYSQFWSEYVARSIETNTAA